MRLLHIKGDAWSDDPLDIRLAEFYGKPPAYMILSHRWREEEVSFADMMDADTYRARRKKGFSKIEESCRIALQMGLEYAWVDTCCIDKSSSAELSEAINSMYQWYAESNICFAYLDDIENYPKAESLFQGSCWFTRGWTLQELIAPKELYFYSKGWKSLGSKATTCDQLVAASGVTKEVLLNPSSLGTVSIAEKMAWAALRETTRGEDESYSLMGIFGVNMPPLYGEGRERAFRRLQTEIMQASYDHTLFAWNARKATGDMLSSCARDFLKVHRYQRMSYEVYIDSFYTTPPRLDYAMTNVGLNIELPLAPIPERDGLYVAFLACDANEDDSALDNKIQYVGVILEEQRFRNFRRFHRVAFNGSTLLHSSKLDAFAIVPTNIWISEREREGDLSRLQSDALSNQDFLIIEIHFNDRLKALQSASSALMENHLGNENMYTSVHSIQLAGSVTMGAIPNHVIALVAKTKRAGVRKMHDLPTIIVAFGEVDRRLWLYVGEPKWRNEDDVEDPAYLCNLQEDFVFPRGAAWREIMSDITFWTKNPATLLQLPNESERADIIIRETEHRGYCSFKSPDPRLASGAHRMYVGLSTIGVFKE